jgi:hypothetical protein
VVRGAATSGLPWEVAGRTYTSWDEYQDAYFNEPMDPQDEEDDLVEVFHRGSRHELNDNLLQEATLFVEKELASYTKEQLRLNNSARDVLAAIERPIIDDDDATEKRILKKRLLEIQESLKNTTEIMDGMTARSRLLRAWHQESVSTTAPHNDESSSPLCTHINPPDQSGPCGPTFLNQTSSMSVVGQMNCVDVIRSKEQTRGQVDTPGAGQRCVEPSRNGAESSRTARRTKRGRRRGGRRNHGIKRSDTGEEKAELESIEEGREGPEVRGSNIV